MDIQLIQHSLLKRQAFPPKRNENLCSNKTMHVNVYTNFIYNLQKLETTPIVIQEKKRKDCTYNRKLHFIKGNELLEEERWEE